MNHPANSIRGECEFLVGEASYVLRPSFAALVAAEEEIGSLFGLVERASAGELTIGEMTALIWHCLKVDNRPARDDVGAAVIAMGLVEAAKPVRQILSQVLKGMQ